MGLMGEISTSTVGPLVLGALCDWSSGAAVTLYMPPLNISGLVLFHSIARSVTGTQPLSYTLTLGGVPLISGASLPASGKYYRIDPSGLISLTTSPGVIAATPLGAAAGTVTFDLFGYTF